MNQVGGGVALVTGAGSGIGRATPILFAREAAKVEALVLFLVSDSAFLITGTEVRIDGVESLLQG